MVGACANAHPFRSRLLMIGASNVRRGLLCWMKIAMEMLPRPIDFIVVAGHGRSYGVRNNVIGWSLPGISNLDWSSHWSIADSTARYAILTDVGNDIMYGSEVNVLLRWVSTCIESISIADRAMIVGLPIERAKRVRRGQFELFRKIFFKKSLVTLEDVLERASEVDEALRESAARARLKWFQPLTSWYGWDPIHIQRRLHQEAWRILFQALLDGTSETIIKPSNESCDRSILRRNEVPRLTWRNRFRLIFSRANRQTWFDRDQSSPQPYVHFSDGSQVSFY